MTKTSTLSSLYLLTISITLVLNRALLAKSDVLKIRLIHPDSPESPFFQSNLAGKERIKRLVSQSNLRANQLDKETLSSSYVGAQIDVQAYHYLLKIGIGTFNSKPPYKEYFLEMDTGSGLIWLQCEGCTKCFDQTMKPFPHKKSSSFRPLHEQYEYIYGDGSITSGVLAQETFSLRSKSGKLAKFPNVKFGCGLHNHMVWINDNNGSNKIAGIMGLGWTDSSFVEQLGPKINSKFSYCLPLHSGNLSNTYLTFGDDRRCCLKRPKKTPLYSLNGFPSYFVDLQGLSINKKRLKINPNTFGYQNFSGPGCLFDTGTPYSRIKTPAFEILKQELEKYLSRSKGLKKIEGDSLELCYEMGNGNARRVFDVLPDITFHLRGSKADLVVESEAAFDVYDGNRVCLAMVRDDRKSTIGSRQQTNHRITYDVGKRQLVFYRQNCAKDS